MSAWRTVDDFVWSGEEQPCAADPEKIIVLLVEGSARTRLYAKPIVEQILPPFLQSVDFAQKTDVLYVVLVYGDYPPSSSSVAQTLYVGRDREAVVGALQSWPFVGGDPVRNALHEGLAAALDSMLLCQPKAGWSAQSLVIITSTLTHEEFHAQPMSRLSTWNNGLCLEELLAELKSQKCTISFFSPSSGMAKTFDTTLSKVYETEGQVKSVSVEAPKGWILRVASCEQRTAGSASSNAIEGSFGDLDSLTTGRGSVLEAAVKQFLFAVLKLPQNQRADAIKRHLESPTYSVEYKQCVVSIVRQMQNTARLAGSSGSAPRDSLQKSRDSVRSPRTVPPLYTVPPPPASLPPSPSPPPPPAQPPAPPAQPSPSLSSPPQFPGKTPIWYGRLAFHHTVDAFFEVAAVPCANPKSATPQTIPTTCQYNVECWPPVFRVMSFVPLKSPAIAKSVPISKLVELLPFTADSQSSSTNHDIATVFRNLLATRQVVGLIRLGSTHAMLIAARPQNLVGMIISREAAASVSPEPAPSATAATTPTSQQSLLQGRSTATPYQLRRDPVKTSSHYAPTPDAILRQHRPGTSSAHSTSSAQLPSVSPAGGEKDPPSNHPTSTIDVFNTLIESQMTDLGDTFQDSSTPIDLTDYSYPASNQYRSLFGNNDPEN